MSILVTRTVSSSGGVTPLRLIVIGWYSAGDISTSCESTSALNRNAPAASDIHDRFGRKCGRKVATGALAASPARPAATVAINATAKMAT